MRKNDKFLQKPGTKKIKSIYICMGHELTFCELRSKDVINAIDGKSLGRINDIVFSRHSAKVLGFIVPGERGFQIFKRREDIFVPFERIVKIGIDVIIVELRPHYHTEKILEID